MSGRTGKSTVSNSFPAFLQCRQKRYRFFYDAAVFLYSDIERNDTRNFREKKILRVALSGSGVY